MKNNLLFGIYLSTALVACTTAPTKEQTGTVVGGVLGGVLGAQVGGGTGQIAATIVGAIAGGMLGGTVGRAMSENDRLRAAQALETTPTGTAYQWTNPDNGRQFGVTPTRTYSNAGGPCREYRINSVIEGRPEVVVGTACRQPDGHWHTQG
jgi:surface antigen